MIIDPTYSSNNPTLDGYTLSTQSVGATCPVSASSSVTGTNVLVIAQQAAAANDYCYRAWAEYDTSPIPSSSVVTDSHFLYDVALIVGTPENCDFVGMTVQPSVATDEQIWDDILSGTVMVNNDATCTTAGDNKDEDLGAAGDAYFQSQLASGWASIGIKGNDETRGAANESSQLASEEDAAATPKPTLQITYTTIPPPDAVTDLVLLSLAQTQLCYDWTAPSAGGGAQVIIGYQINVTTPYTSNPLVFVNDTGTTITDYCATGLIEGTQYSTRVSAWTNVTGSHPQNNATGNVVNATTTVPGAAETIDESILVIGDTARFTAYVNVTSGGIGANLTAIDILLNGTVVETNSTIQNSTGTPYGVNIGPFWIRMDTGDLYEFAVQTSLQNASTTVTNSTLFYDSREYGPDYLPAIDNPEIQGDVNATITRYDDEDGILLKVNRIDVSTGDTWQIECIAQTNSEAAQTKDETQSWEGDWQNTTNTGYFNTTFTGYTNSHAYITCFNEDELFSLTSFTNSSLALLGIELFDQSYGSMLGVPVGVFFLVMTAGMANKRTAPTFIIVITGIAGTMATIGFFTFEPIVWGLALVTAMLGIFVNQKIF